MATTRLDLDERIPVTVARQKVTNMKVAREPRSKETCFACGKDLSSDDLYSECAKCHVLTCGGCSFCLCEAEAMRAA